MVLNGSIASQRLEQLLLVEAEVVPAPALVVDDRPARLFGLKRSLPEAWISGLTKWVSGGIASSGWASSISRSSVVPERPTPTTNGAGQAGSDAAAGGVVAQRIWIE